MCLHLGQLQPLTCCHDLAPPWSLILCLVKSAQHEQRYVQLLSVGTRFTLQPAERFLSMMCTMGLLCGGLFRTVLVKNHFVVSIARSHGRSVSAQRFPMRPCSLPLHRAFFHPRSCRLPRLWSRPFALWTVGMEMDWHRDDYWRDRAHLHSRARSWPLSAKWNGRGLTSR